MKCSSDPFSIWLIVLVDYYYYHHHQNNGIRCKTHQKYSIQFLWRNLPTWDSNFFLSFVVDRSRLLFITIQIILSPLTTHSNIFISIVNGFSCLDAIWHLFHFIWLSDNIRSDCLALVHCLSMCPSKLK